MPGFLDRLFSSRNDDAQPSAVGSEPDRSARKSQNSTGAMRPGRSTDQPLTKRQARAGQSDELSTTSSTLPLSSDTDQAAPLKPLTSESASKSDAAQAPIGELGSSEAEASPSGSQSSHLGAFGARGGKRIVPAGQVTRLKGDVAALARTVEQSLADLGAPGHVVAATVGPTITRLGIAPAIIETYATDGTLRKRERVRVSRILARSNDLALALGARSLRFEAPVPGQPYMGLEIPNLITEAVPLASLLSDAGFKQFADRAALPVALGRDVAGRPVVADLARLPHLLVAGSTGSGKSVALNGLLAALLSLRSPAELRLLVIDPKRVEFSWLGKVSHLLAPVVVDTEDSVEVLGKLESEMSRRYDLLSSAGVREIGVYNEVSSRPEPRLVLVIDELADLMMLAPADVERSICRLAQLGRAAGIHLVVATQRPSVDVLTGLIKANLPARLAFMVSSQVDSRTILDSGGAELLLGQGDFLYQPPDLPKSIRGQGALVPDEHLDRLAKRLRRKRGVADPYADLFADLQSPVQQQAQELLRKARELAASHDQLSVNFLQRKLRIGNAKAKELIAVLTDEGILDDDDDV